MTRTDNETTLTIYSIVENSKPFQNRLGKFLEKHVILYRRNFCWKTWKSSRKENSRCFEAGDYDSWCYCWCDIQFEFGSWSRKYKKSWLQCPICSKHFCCWTDHWQVGNIPNFTSIIKGCPWRLSCWSHNLQIHLQVITIWIHSTRWQIQWSRLVFLIISEAGCPNNIFKKIFGKL